MTSYKHGDANILPMILVQIKDGISSGVILPKSACYIFLRVKIEDQKQKKKHFMITKSGEMGDKDFVHPYKCIHTFKSTRQVH